MRRALYTLRNFGIDPIKFLDSFANLPHFIIQLVRFKSKSMWSPIKLSMVLTDRKSSSGSADGHYFWQDLITAQWIYQAKPRTHIDIGSRIDGFVSKLLVFREVNVIDIRKPELEVAGLVTTVIDAQKSMDILGKFDSVSSLHSLEHFGLGRYGDPLDPNGHRVGLENISRLVKSGGHLYISYPLGNDVVEFNAQRLLPIDWASKNLTDFTLEEMVLIPWKGKPQTIDIAKIEEAKYPQGSCGLYRYRRN